MHWLWMILQLGFEVSNIFENPNGKIDHLIGGSVIDPNN